MNDKVSGQKQTAPQPEKSSLSVLDLSTLINDYMKTTKEMKEQLKTQKQMLKDSLMNDKSYHDYTERIKALTKEKSARKQLIVKEPAVEAVIAKVQELQGDLKDLEEKLSAYLQEYQRVSGTTTFEDANGELMQIVPVYKLVKRSS